MPLPLLPVPVPLLPALAFAKGSSAPGKLPRASAGAANCLEPAAAAALEVGAEGTAVLSRETPNLLLAEPLPVLEEEEGRAAPAAGAAGAAAAARAGTAAEKGEKVLDGPTAALAITEDDDARAVEEAADETGRV